MRYQIEHDVVKSSEYINMSVANGKFVFVDHNDPEYRKNLSKSRKGKMYSEESKKKMSESAKKRFENPEERKKISETMTGKTRGPYKKRDFKWKMGIF